MILLLSGCNETTYISNCEFDNSHNKAYLNEKPYSGSIWSENKDVEIVCENGDMIEFRVYHTNGNIAIKEFRNPRDYRWYSEAGNLISKSEFRERFPFAMRKMAQTKELMRNQDLRNVSF